MELSRREFVKLFSFSGVGFVTRNIFYKYLKTSEMGKGNDPFGLPLCLPFCLQAPEDGPTVPSKYYIPIVEN